MSFSIRSRRFSASSCRSRTLSTAGSSLSVWGNVGSLAPRSGFVHPALRSHWFSVFVGMPNSRAAPVGVYDRSVTSRIACSLTCLLYAIRLAPSRRGYPGDRAPTKRGEGHFEHRVKKGADDGGTTSFADYVWKPVVLIEMK